MARRESKAQAGFFPCPPHLIPSVGAMLRPEVSTDASRGVLLVDPCAGEGVALRLLRDAIRPPHMPGIVDTYACELEATRAERCRAELGNDWRTRERVLAGDFFHVRWPRGFFDLLWLNCPYDQDREYRRLEARWLAHAAPMLTRGGVLVFVVPYYCLSACAAMMALHFEDVRCYRFPGQDFDAFRQVFVLGRKVDRAAPDPSVAELCRRWTEDPTSAPELPDADHAPPYRVVPSGRRDSTLGARVDRGEWVMAGFDVSGVAGLAPWASERGPMQDLDHPPDLCQRMGAVYPVVSPPRPVHLAAALSAGVFNGLHVQPNPGHVLPALLVKGTFRRRWETVDTKANKDGEVTSETQVERPELQVYALDLDAAEYHELRASAEITAAATVRELTFADLLERYSGSLLTALRAACPVLHDPTRDPEPVVDGLGRPLWPAQTNAVRAAGKLLDQPGYGVLVVGEVGTGKTSIASALAHVRGARRVLVVCPPHLLASWTKQVETVLPHYGVLVLDRVSSVDALRTHPGPVVALLSREAAKLGHGWAAVEPTGRRDRATCPACGAEVDGERHAERRARCEAPLLAARGPVGRWVLRHRALLVRCDPSNPSVRMLVPPTAAGRRHARWADARPAGDRERQQLTAALAELYGLLRDQPVVRERVLPAVAWACPETAPAGLATFPEYQREPDRHRDLMRIREMIGLACDVRPDLGPHPDENLGYAYRGGALDGQRYGVRTAAECWRRWRAAWDDLHGCFVPYRDEHGHQRTGADFYPYAGERDEGEGYRVDGGRATYRGNERGSAGAIRYALTSILRAAGLSTRPCGEPLFQATATPRRFPIGTYIARRASDAVDMLVIDEAHEMASDTSAQGIVSARLAQMAQRRRIPVLYMTGSLVNGYAESAFHALRAVSPHFRAQFNHRDRDRFVDTYGLRKRVLVYESGQSRATARGAHSERVLAGTKKAGQAPGVLPVLLLDHLLRASVILHKADLEIGLPPQAEETVRIPLDPWVAENLDGLVETVKKAIRETRFQAGCAGKLFGAFGKLLSYPDLAACGDYEVRWPDGVPVVSTKSFEVSPGGLVARVAGGDRTRLLGKEAWLLDRLADELGQGRGVMVLPAHVELLDRLAWVCEQAGIEALVLRSEKVPPHKREAWIDRHLNTRSRRVLITNPVCVQTGLNNLVSLATSIWYENPECKPLVYRQANGRIHRPGQTLPVRASFAVYDHTLPLAGHKLLLHKVGVSLAVDGLDPDAVLEAAGVGSEFSAGLNVGQQLYRMLVEQAGE